MPLSPSSFALGLQRTGWRGREDKANTVIYMDENADERDFLF